MVLGLSLFYGVAESATPLKVGLTGKYPPFNYFDPNGNLVGFDVEVAKALCERLQRPCAFRILPWDGILAALLARKIDVVVGSMAITPERQKQALFSDPYYESGAQLFVRDTTTDPEQPGFKIGVTLGTTYGEFARSRYPEAEIRTYKGETEIFQDIEAGRLQGMVTDRLVGGYMNRVRNGGLSLSGPLLYRERIGIPMRPFEKKLRMEVNGALADLLQSETYSELHARYFGEAAPGTAEIGVAFRWQNSLRLMLKAWGSTLVLSLQGLTLGILLSLVLAALLIFPPSPIRRATLVYVDFVRATPFMLQLFALYFGLPAMGIQLPAWIAAVAAISIHLSAYLSETIKVAYQSIPTGQHHAAKILGMNRALALKHVIFPQMLPLLLTPTLNTLVAMIKDSAIVSVISVHELTMQTQQLISSTFRPIEFYLFAAFLYALLTYPLLILGRRLEIRYRAKGLLHGQG